MTGHGGRNRPAIFTGVLTRGTRAAAPDPAAEPGVAAYTSRLLWVAGVAAAALSIVAFVLWIRDGAGILLEMILTLCV